MIISTCGYGTTGASAVADFIKGYSKIQLYDKSEFQLLHQADGICDLKYQLTQKCDRISSNAAIKRFLRIKNNNEGMLLSRHCKNFEKFTNDYIDELVICSWEGRSNGDPSDVSNLSTNKNVRQLQRGIDYFLRHRNKMWHFPRFQNRYYSSMPVDKFDKITRTYLNNIFNSLGINTEEDVMFDMLFSATNPSAGMEFFDNPKAIVVDRDPRDLFLAARRNVWANAFMPWDTAEKFVDYYKAIRTTSKDGNNVLRIQYEDLIYHYYETTETIMDFLGYQSRPDNEFKFFNPDVSVRYTNRKVDQTEFADQIAYIEKKLPEYLYEFSKYVKVEDQLNAYKKG